MPFLLGWTATIFLLCSVPGRYVPAMGWMQLLSIDKLVHASLFLLLGLLIHLLVFRRGMPPSTIHLLIMLAVLYGCVLEILQATLFVDRSMEYLDAVANTAGVMASLFFRKRMLLFSQRGV